MRLNFLLISMLLSGAVLSQPARGILKDTTLQGPIVQIQEVQFNGDNLTEPAWKYNYFFDAEGNVLREEQWEESEYVVRWNRKYDDRGNLIEHIRENKFQEVDKDSFAYDKQSNLTYEAKDIGGPFPKTLAIQYDESGLKIREEHYVSGNRESTFYYNYEGENMTMVESMVDGNKKCIEWNEYDKKGRITKSTKLTKSRKGDQDTCVIVYSYPEENTELTDDGCKPQTEKLVFNDRGQLIYEEFTRKTRRGENKTIIKREFNSRGQVTSKEYKILNQEGEEDYSSSTIYVYEYDEYDNWTKLEWYKIKEGKKELSMRFVREITYSK